MRITTLTMGLGGMLLLASTGLVLALGGSALSRDEASQRLQAAGYLEVQDLEHDDGLWEADVRRADGSYGEVAVDAGSGEIYDTKDGRSVLDADAIRRAIEAGGYVDVHELERDGVIWEAQGRDANGRPVELRLSGFDAHLISVTPDDDEDHDDDGRNDD